MTVFGDTWDYLTTASNWTGAGGMLELLLEQLLLSITALAMAMLVGLPVALMLGHLGRGGFLAINVSPTSAAPCRPSRCSQLLVTADLPGTD